MKKEPRNLNHALFKIPQTVSEGLHLSLSDQEIVILFVLMTVSLLLFVLMMIFVGLEQCVTPIERLFSMQTLNKK